MKSFRIALVADPSGTAGLLEVAWEKTVFTASFTVAT